jgi:hypothetical protein
MGVDQVVLGHRIPKGKWLDVPSGLPLDVAMEALRLRHVDIRRANDGGAGLFWMSALSQGDGYGTAAENYLLDLRHMVNPLVIRDCWFRLDEGLDAYTVEQLRKPVSELPEYGLCMATPGEFRKLPTKIRVGFTMYESDDPLKFHPEWAHESRFADKLIVPSEYSKEVFGQFFKGPIETCDLIVHKDFYQALKHERKDTFTFVTYGTLNGRKSPMETIFAFLAAFPADLYPNLRLELKTRGAIFGGSKGHIPTVADRRVKIIDATWDRATLIEWLNKADCMLFATKGEGYGMPPREAICLGLPTIYAHHTGMVDLIDYALPVSVGKEEDSPIGGKWYVPDWENMVDQMRLMYDEYEEESVLAQSAARTYIATKTDAASRLLSLIMGTRRGKVTTGGNKTDYETFYKHIKERIPSGRILCIGHGGAAELSEMGYEAFMTDAEPLLLDRDNMPRVDAIVWQDGIQQFYHEELRRIFRQLMRIAPVFFSTPTAWNANWIEEGAYLRQRGEWSELLRGLHAPTEYYGDKRFLMGEVRGEAVTAQGVEMGIYLNGTWHPDVIE